MHYNQTMISIILKKNINMILTVNHQNKVNQEHWTIKVPVNLQYMDQEIIEILMSQD